MQNYNHANSAKDKMPKPLNKIRLSTQYKYSRNAFQKMLWGEYFIVSQLGWFGWKIGTVQGRMVTGRKRKTAESKRGNIQEMPSKELLQGE